MALLSFDDIFARILEGETVFVPFATRKNFECMRVSLSRKTANYRKLMASIADDPFETQYLRCTCEKLEQNSLEQVENVLPFRGQFRLAPIQENKNGRGRLYQIDDV